MRFRTQAFLYCFAPFALLLAGSFWMIQKLVQSTVRDGVRVSLLENNKVVARTRSKADLQNSQFLRVAGENAALKAGMQLLLAYPDNAEARRTVEDQLRELCDHMGFALLVVSGPPPPGSPESATHGVPLAGVLRTDGTLRPLDPAALRLNRTGLMLIRGTPYQIASVPIDQADENIGTLSVGQLFDLADFATPTVLLHNGHVLQSGISGVRSQDVESAMSHCPETDECDVRLGSVNYLSLTMQSLPLGDGFLLRSVQNLDAAVAPVHQILRTIFGSVALVSLLIALIVGFASAASIVRPIATVVERLRQAEKTGDLPEFRTDISGVLEIQGLTATFNRTAATIRESRENLTLAYVEFVQSLASALDARDPYTAGHSHRVSQTAREIARAMSLTPEMVERVRVGALLHDIGKIGVADRILRKAGRLTADEFAIVRMHPEIGRRILEGVRGFGAYLEAVELHHENWDGTGYPHGQSGETTPVDARIIHVADAYDAMTTDRPYRRGMTHTEALRTLRANAGTQFDPAVVLHFAGPEVEIPEAETTEKEATRPEYAATGKPA
jgi:HD-GYP domain-containing protein (c-di-GMP phosphodiesterase class II)